MEKNNLIPHKFLGFSSFGDFFKTLFKTRMVGFHKILNFAFIMSIILLTVPWLEEWIWSPFWTLYVVIAVVVLDWITAIGANNYRLTKKEREGFVTLKAVKFVVTLLSYLVLLVVLKLLSKAIEAFNMDSIINPDVFSVFATTVWFLIVVINIASSVSHMERMKILPSFLSKFVRNFIDVQKQRITKEALEKPTEAPSKSGNNESI